MTTLVHMAVVNQLANNRQGTQKAKTRSEVSGGGKKTVETEGNRSRKTGIHKSSPVGQAAEWYSLRYREITASR